jgi:uncharacterized phage-like protein YoqJ
MPTASYVPQQDHTKKIKDYQQYLLQRHEQSKKVYLTEEEGHLTEVEGHLTGVEGHLTGLLLLLKMMMVGLLPYLW